MKVVLTIVVSILLSSCCLVTSLECNCKPPEPYLVEATKDWIAPFQSQGFTFIKRGAAITQQIKRDYFEDTECVGGDECCSDFPIHVNEFTFDNAWGDVLLHTRAIMSSVEFYASADTYLISVDVNTGSFSDANKTSFSEKDTIISGVSTRKFIFHKIDSVDDMYNRILFKKLEFVKGIGVTSFTDLNGLTWDKQ